MDWLIYVTVVYPFLLLVLAVHVVDDIRKVGLGGLLGGALVGTILVVLGTATLKYALIVTGVTS